MRLYLIQELFNTRQGHISSYDVIIFCDKLLWWLNQILYIWYGNLLLTHTWLLSGSSGFSMDFNIRYTLIRIQKNTILNQYVLEEQDPPFPIHSTGLQEWNWRILMLLRFGLNPLSSCDQPNRLITQYRNNIETFIKWVWTCIPRNYMHVLSY